MLKAPPLSQLPIHYSTFLSGSALELRVDTCDSDFPRVRRLRKMARDSRLGNRSAQSGSHRLPDLCEPISMIFVILTRRPTIIAQGGLNPSAHSTIHAHTHACAGQQIY